MTTDPEHEARVERVRAELHAGRPVGEVVKALLETDGLLVGPTVRVLKHATGLGLGQCRAVIEPVAAGQRFEERFPGQYAQTVTVHALFAPYVLLEGLLHEAIVSAAPWLTLLPDGPERTRAFHGPEPMTGREVVYLSPFDELQARLREELNAARTTGWVRTVVDSPQRVVLRFPRVPAPG